MSGWGILLVVSATAIGAFVQGSVGFGHNLIAAPAMAFVDDRFVPGPAILGATLLTALMLARDRHDVSAMAYLLIHRDLLDAQHP